MNSANYNKRTEHITRSTLPLHNKIKKYPPDKPNILDEAPENIGKNFLEEKKPKFQNLLTRQVERNVYKALQREATQSLLTLNRTNFQAQFRDENSNVRQYIALTMRQNVSRLDKCDT